MRLVQTAFLEGERLQTLIDGDPWLASSDDGRLVIARRAPIPEDWVNGEFVGDHPEPDDGRPHVHGEPS